MTQLYEIKVRLTSNQKKNLSNAYHKRETIVLRLTKDSLSGNDTLYVPAMVKKRLEKNRKLNKGMDIKLAKTNIRKQVGGSLLSLARSFGPMIDKTLGLSGLTTKEKKDILNAIKTGYGAPQVGQPKQRPRRSLPKPTTQDGGLIIARPPPPPFYGNWPDDTINIMT